jgi:hypothetical protein
MNAWVAAIQAVPPHPIPVAQLPAARAAVQNCATLKAAQDSALKYVAPLLEEAMADDRTGFITPAILR